MSSTTSELAELQQALRQVRSCVGALRTAYGDTAAVRRISNDVERLDIDIAELASESTAPSSPVSSVPRAKVESAYGDVVEVPDTPYDPSLWQDADDEGLGGHHPDTR